MGLIFYYLVLLLWDYSSLLLIWAHWMLDKKWDWSFSQNGVGQWLVAFLKCSVNPLEWKRCGLSVLDTAHVHRFFEPRSRVEYLEEKGHDCCVSLKGHTSPAGSHLAGSEPDPLNESLTASTDIRDKDHRKWIKYHTSVIMRWMGRKRMRSQQDEQLPHVQSLHGDTGTCIHEHAHIAHKCVNLWMSNNFNMYCMVTQDGSFSGVGEEKHVVQHHFLCDVCQCLRECPWCSH